MPNFTTIRTVTPSALKWLLNERATIAGEISKGNFRQAALSKKLLALQRLAERQNRLLQQSLEKNTALQATLSAMETTIGLAYANVEPSAAGVVKAWAGRYGERGALINFVGQTLRNAASQPVSTTELIDKAIAQFALDIVVSPDRISLKYSIKSSLRHLAKKDLVEKIIGPIRGGSPQGWCWKQQPTLADLAEQATAAYGAASNDRPAHADPAGNKVAGQ